MSWLWHRARQLRVWKDCKGQDLVEYGLAAGMVAVIAVAVAPVLPETVRSVFTRASTVIMSSLGG